MIGRPDVFQDHPEKKKSLHLLKVKYITRKKKLFFFVCVMLHNTPSYSPKEREENNNREKKSNNKLFFIIISVFFDVCFLRVSAQAGTKKKKVLAVDDQEHIERLIL